MAYLSDIEIAQQCKMNHIKDIAKKLEIPMVFKLFLFINSSRKNEVFY